MSNEIWMNWPILMMLVALVNVVVSAYVFHVNGMALFQRLALISIIWIVPVLGALLFITLHYFDRRSAKAATLF